MKSERKQQQNERIEESNVYAAADFLGMFGLILKIYFIQE